MSRRAMMPLVAGFAGLFQVAVPGGGGMRYVLEFRYTVPSSR